MRHAGFTVLELLVASLLLSMLVTILTMIFNQSSLAWRTGVADVMELGRARSEMGSCHDIEDDALPGLGETGVGSGSSDSRKIEYRTVSVFRNWNGGSSFNPSSPSINSPGRLFDRIDADGSRFPYSISDARNGGPKTVPRGDSSAGRAFVVGVRSFGPDLTDPADDISTYPAEVDL